MGVSLERVQNKFACIIGELCSEPDILSQFAVWVDLRIAEYKAKGSIALECSGDTPDPRWLKGLKLNKIIKSDDFLLNRPCKFGNRNAQRIHVGQAYSIGRSGTLFPGVSHHPTSDTTRLEEQDAVDNDIVEVMVKHEPKEIFQVSLHPHEERNRDNSRKRQASQVNNNFENLSSKSRKLSPTCETSSSTTGQGSSESLLSVIGHSVQDDASDMNLINDETSEDTQPEIVKTEVFEEWNSLSDVVDEDQIVHPSTSASNQSDSVITSLLDNRCQLMPGSSHYSTSGRNLADSSRTDLQETSSGTYVQSCHLSIYELHAKAHKKCAGNALQGFLRDQGESREAHEIPPEELDLHLKQFFKTIKRKTGDDYKPNSLSSLRKYLNMHLRAKGYPTSIVKSDQFLRSQIAFRERVTELEATMEASLT